MKIKIGVDNKSIVPVIISTCQSVELEGVYNGVGIQTDQGYFGIAQRDSGIEVMLDGELIWASYEDISKIENKEITDSASNSEPVLLENPNFILDIESFIE